MKWQVILIVCLLGYQVARSQVIQITTQEIPLPGTLTEDTVYYSKDRQLQWSDFTGKVRQSSNMAAVSFTGFSYNARVLQRLDTIFVHLYLQVYFVRPASWFRPHKNTTYALSHEQLHFDITKLMEEQFKDSLYLKNFDKEYYPHEIHKLYWFYWRKMNGVQEKFDTETENGSNRTKEIQWQNKISVALKKYE